MYFSTLGGLDETRYVFIEGNHLPERFSRTDKFVIAETGFGSGLNFVAAVDCWLKSALVDAQLHYISIEKYPFAVEDIEKALNSWPLLSCITDELLAAYPVLTHGFHYRSLFQGRVSLTLIFGDALDLLPNLNAKVDAWFLDGFAPSKNTSLWSSRVLQLIAQRTAMNGTFATFTAAGDVRRGLQAVGFQVCKRPGFAKKREMLLGQLENVAIDKSPTPWFSLSLIKQEKEKHALVIGAGIAGMTTAVALARRGWKVSVIEKHEQVATEASGNPAGAVMPRLTADMSIDARFYLSAFLYAINWLTQMPSTAWHAQGAIQFSESDKANALKEIGLPASVIAFLQAEEVSAKIGAPIQQEGMFYPSAGWLVPQLLCQHLLKQYPGIRLVSSTKIESLDYNNGQWLLSNASGQVAEAPIVVLATGSETEALLPGSELGINAVRGQLTYSHSTTTKLNMPVCYDGYVIPMADGQYCVGATYDRHSRDKDVLDKDHQTNIAALQHVLPGIDSNITGGRVAFRASTQDHLPLVGPVADSRFYLHQYGDLYHGRPTSKYATAKYLPGLYINTGHGSRGLTSCPLAGEMIACMINREPMPIAEDIRLALHPARFLVRKLKRGRVSE